jgi:dihydrofolate reductase
MSKVVYAISASLDGFVAGADDNPDQGMGRGGDVLHRWASQPDETDTRVLTEGFAGLGAHIVGRRMFDNAQAWHGTPPGGLPCIVVTHRPPAQWTGPDSPFVFAGSVAEAVDTARGIAGDKDVAIGGGASIGRQALQAGLVDRIHIQLVPVLLGAGVRLIDQLGDPIMLRHLETAQSSNTTHLSYEVVR